MNFLLTKLRNKLLAIVTISMIVVIIPIFFGFLSAYNSLTKVDSVFEQEISQERLAIGMALNFKKQVQEWKNVLIRGKDPKQLEKYWNKFQKTEAKIQESGEIFVTQLENQEAKTLVSQFIEEHKKMGVAYREGFEAFKAANFDPNAGDKAVKGIDRAPTKMLEEAAAFIKKRSTENFHSSVTEGQGGIFNTLYILLPIFVVIAAAFVVFMNIAVGRPASKVKVYLEGLAAGDFTQHLECTSKDEFGSIAVSAQMVQTELGNLIQTISRMAEKLDSDSSQLAEFSHQNMQVIDNQNQQSERVSVSMNEMTTTIQDVARHATEAAAQATDADSQARDGNSLVNQVLTSINNLAQEVGNTATAVNSVEQGATEIGSVIDVINGIAEQTNLLALNAAIEAARAGEQGRGFAVVADEVRTLAARTQESTEEIRAMIEKLQKGTKSAAHAMSLGEEKVAETEDLAAKADTALSKITESVSSISLANMQIASAAEEQGSVSTEINENVASIRNLANEVYGIVQQTDTSTTDLAELSSELRDLTTKFKV
ncbi:MAG: methyl-accepting chemotaxis protein [Gammaproteobacteria bacterium]|nr:methyl-accepting chemotaxis protein [Gammaproteobacteria bacterium]